MTALLLRKWQSSGVRLSRVRHAFISAAILFSVLKLPGYALGPTTLRRPNTTGSRRIRVRNFVLARHQLPGVDVRTALNLSLRGGTGAAGPRNTRRSFRNSRLQSRGWHSLEDPWLHTLPRTRAGHCRNRPQESFIASRAEMSPETGAGRAILSPYRSGASAKDRPLRHRQIRQSPGLPISRRRNYEPRTAG